MVSDFGLLSVLKIMFVAYISIIEQYLRCLVAKFYFEYIHDNYHTVQPAASIQVTNNEGILCPVKGRL